MLLCDVLPDGTVAATVLVEPIYDTNTGERVGTRTVDPVTGATYTPAGTLGPCQPEGCARQLFQNLRCDDGDGDGIGEVTYVELWAVDPCNGAAPELIGTYLGGDLASPYTPVSPVDCPPPVECPTCTEQVLCDTQPVTSPIGPMPPNPAGGYTLANGVTWSRTATDVLLFANDRWRADTTPDTFTFSKPVTLVWAASFSGPGTTTVEIPPGNDLVTLSAGHSWDPVTRRLSATAGTTDSTLVTTFRARNISSWAAPALVGAVAGAFAYYGDMLVTVDVSHAFLRRTCRNCAGTVLSQTDTELDGTTAYTPAGTVGVCGPVDADRQRYDAEVIELCDVAADGTATVFLRHLRYGTLDGIVYSRRDTTLDGITTYTPAGAVGRCPQITDCASPTTPVAMVGLCLADGTPIAVTVQRDCDGVVTSEGWINLTTGAFSAGAPPAGAVACGDSQSVQVSGTFCDLDAATGDVLGLVLIEYSYAADGTIDSVRLVDAVTGATYTLQGTISVCPAGVEQPERDLVQLCDTAGDGTVTAFVRDYARDENGAITGHSDYLLDGTAYVPAGTIGICHAECRNSSTVLVCDVPADSSSEITPTIVDGVAADIAQTQFANLAGPYTSLWTGDSLVYPAGTGPGQEHLIAVGQITGGAAGCEGASGTVTVSVRVTQNGPGTGQLWDGALRLFRGTTVLMDDPVGLYAPPGHVQTLTVSAPVTAADLVAGDIRFGLALETFHGTAKSWTADEFSATIELEGCEATSSVQFLRTLVTDCVSGEVVSTTDTTLDGDPYTVTGEVSQCTPAEPAECRNCEAVVLCDTVDGAEPHSFLRTVCRDCTGAVISVLDTELDGTAPYAVIGTVAACGGCVRCETLDVCDSEGAPIPAEVTATDTAYQPAGPGQRPLPGGGAALWSGGTLAFPAEAAAPPDGGDQTQVYRAVAAVLAAERPACDDGTVTISASVHITHTASTGNGFGATGHYRLLLDGAQLAIQTVPAGTVVGYEQTLSLSATVSAGDLASGKVVAELVLETFQGDQQGWSADEFTVSAEFGGCPTPFQRVVCRSCDGTTVSTTNLTYAGDPYTVLGEVVQCAVPDPTCVSAVQLVELCDLNPDVAPDGEGRRCATPFLRHLVFDCDGNVVSQRDTAINGVDDYTPVLVVDCGDGGVPALVELPWPQTGVGPDPALPGNQDWIYTVTNPDTGEAAEVHLHASRAAGGNCGPLNPANPAFNNPTAYTLTLDAVAQQMSTFRLDLIDFDTFEGVSGINPPPSRVEGDAVWYGGSTIVPTTNSGTAQVYWDQPPAQITFSYGNYGGGTACFALAFQGMTYKPEGCCGCGSAASECQHCETVVLCDAGAPVEVTLGRDLTDTDPTPYFKAADNLWKLPLAGGGQVFWDGQPLHWPTENSPPPPAQQANGQQHHYIAALIQGEPFVADCPGVEPPTEVTITASAVIENLGPTTAIATAALFRLHDGATQLAAGVQSNMGSGSIRTITFTHTVTYEQWISGTLAVDLDAETYTQGAKGWETRQFTLTATAEVAGCPTGFLRTICRDCTGTVVSTTDTTPAGAAYTPTGTVSVGACPEVAEEPCQSCETLVLCDGAAEETATITGSASSGTLANGVTWAATGATSQGPGQPPTRNNGDGSWWGLHSFPHTVDAPTTWTFSRPSVVEFSVFLHYYPTVPAINNAQLPAGLEVVHLPDGYSYNAATGVLTRTSDAAPGDPCTYVTDPQVETSARFRTAGPVTSLRTAPAPGSRAAVCGTFFTYWAGALAVSPGGSFLRTICRDCDGSVTSVTDTALDGETPYTPTGAVGACREEPPCDKSVLSECVYRLPDTATGFDLDQSTFPGCWLGVATNPTYAYGNRVTSWEGTYQTNTGTASSVGFTSPDLGGAINFTAFTPAIPASPAQSATGYQGTAVINGITVTLTATAGNGLSLGGTLLSLTPGDRFRVEFSDPVRLTLTTSAFADPPTPHYERLCGVVAETVPWQAVKLADCQGAVTVVDQDTRQPLPGDATVDCDCCQPTQVCIQQDPEQVVHFITNEAHLEDNSVDPVWKWSLTPDNPAATWWDMYEGAHGWAGAWTVTDTNTGRPAWWLSAHPNGNSIQSNPPLPNEGPSLLFQHWYARAFFDLPAGADPDSIQIQVTVLNADQFGRAFRLNGGAWQPLPATACFSVAGGCAAYTFGPGTIPGAQPGRNYLYLDVEESVGGASGLMAHLIVTYTIARPEQRSWTRMTCCDDTVYYLDENGQRQEALPEGWSVIPCGSTSAAPVVLCDDDGPFLRHVAYMADGQVTVSNTTLEGGDYNPVGTVGACAGTSTGGGAASSVFTGVRSVTGTLAQNIKGAFSNLQSISLTVLAGDVAVTMTDGAAVSIPAGVTLTWSVARDSDEALAAASFAGLTAGSQYVLNWTYRV
ncbi:hypothetical protein AB0F88_16865 [Streptosporangium sp. NPDC023963]|uniref:hypothetical protein n=1 Tax=Streptosporangium sp. NPDC023963 TaxID=3155608 RepID=UPI003446208D